MHILHLQYRQTIASSSGDARADSGNDAGVMDFAKGHLGVNNGGYTSDVDSLRRDIGDSQAAQM